MLILCRCESWHVCRVQGWQLLGPRDTSFFAAVNLPMLDFHSSTGPQADFNSGTCLPSCCFSGCTRPKR